MEKYAKLLKGLEVCAGPECGIQCPYHGETRGGMTCRARLLADAAITINNESALRESAEEGLRNAVEKLGELDSINTTICAEREKLRADVNDLEAANNTYRTERDKLAADNMELRKTDRPSACDKELVEEVGKLIAQAKYQEGKADALEWFLREWFREGGFQE